MHGTREAPRLPTPDTLETREDPNRCSRPFAGACLAKESWPFGGERREIKPPQVGGDEQVTVHLKPSCSLRESERQGPSGEEASAHWPPQLPVRRHPGTWGRLGGGTLRCSGQLERVAGAGLGNSASRAGGRQDGGCRRGSLLFSSPLTRLLLPRHRPRSREELSNQLHPLLEALCFPPPVPCAVSSSRRPRCPRPSVRPPPHHPHYLSRRPGPTVRGPRARTGRPSSRSVRPGDPKAASSRAGLRGHRRSPSRPALGPRPGHRRRSRGRRGNGGAAAAAATEPSRGEGGISPQAGSAPPASPRHLHPFPRSLPGSAGSPAEHERERERGKSRGGIPPPVAGVAAAGVAAAGAAERSAEPPPPPPRATVSRSASRWRCGRGWGAERSGADSGCAPAAARAPRLPGSPAPGPRSPPGEPGEDAEGVRVRPGKT
ncbi:collagen alpha-1(II) chain-like [Erinaceus europaeus]|uniref:Collagen alpha-1(II) chain-like n=1 Tax=Erinaceus europaeus TaxID=9365 RepID=A0ABM3XDA8_ERIEU|nr:collagen alpha-1(II) chain-like [Erinaceus europaeus]